MVRLEDSVVMNFKVDGLGFRRMKEVVGQGQTWFVYDLAESETPGLAPLVAEYDQNGNLVAKYHHDGGGLLAMTRSNASYWYGFEAIGTVRQLMDSQGQVVDAYAFDAWGNELTSPQSQVPNPFRYVGRHGYYLDTQSALMLLGVRYYKKIVGRFINHDPAMFDLNWYTYAKSNSTRMIDPMGLLSSPEHCQRVCNDLNLRAPTLSCKQLNDELYNYLHDCVYGPSWEFPPSQYPPGHAPRPPYIPDLNKDCIAPAYNHWYYRCHCRPTNCVENSRWGCTGVCHGGNITIGFGRFEGGLVYTCIRVSNCTGRRIKFHIEANVSCWCYGLTIQMGIDPLCACVGKGAINVLFSPGGSWDVGGPIWGPVGWDFMFAITDQYGCVGFGGGLGPLPITVAYCKCHYHLVDVTYEWL